MEKSAEAIDSKGFAMAPLRKTVCILLKAKQIDGRSVFKVGRFEGQRMNSAGAGCITEMARKSHVMFSPLF
jgi:hypothetical protein